MNTFAAHDIQRVKLATSYDMHRVAPKIWQGSFPEAGSGLKRLGFDVLVLCAQELQPPAWTYPGIVVVRAPMDDIAGQSALKHCNVAVYASAYVARLHRNGARVLVTCAAGRNRSGLVTALTLQRLGWKPDASVHAVRTARKNALTNSAFEHFALQGRRLIDEATAINSGAIPVERA